VADSPDRIALPIRVHDFLLACAGRIDDDALTDARELLAMAELDRAIELITASLVAGRIRLAVDERDELLDLVDAVRSSPALVDRVMVDDNVALPRHRFTTGAMDDPSPETGVMEAVSRVVDVLPDIRSLSAVWRTTPAGSPAGPIPQRLVLVETGPDGFAPSTAYRVEQALRRAGIRAAVEVVQAGVDLSDYHGDALAVARRLSLRSVRSHDSHDNDSALFADAPSPRPVTTTRRRAPAGAHAERRPTADHTAGRWQPRIASSDEPPAAEPEPEPVPAYDNRPRHEPVDAAPFEPAPFEDGIRPILPEPVAPEPEPVHVEPVAVEEPVQTEPVHVEAAPVEAAHEPVAPPLPDADEPEPGSDADLSNRERELLRQLHEELAKREQSEPDSSSWQDHRPQPGPPGAEFNPAEFPGEFNPGDFRPSEYNPNEFGGPAWHQSAAAMLDPGNATEQTSVNGIPPYGSTNS
jgi:hypothetical protein